MSIPCEEQDQGCFPWPGEQHDALGAVSHCEIVPECFSFSVTLFAFCSGPAALPPLKQYGEARLIAPGRSWSHRGSRTGYQTVDLEAKERTSGNQKQRHSVRNQGLSCKLQTEEKEEGFLLYSK
jgi:hypothetical protein